MAASNQTPQPEPPPPVEPENVSAFAARVLNQLSLSAWLPGAFLIAGIALLVRFRSKQAISLNGVGAYVEDNWIPVLVLSLPALLITVLLTQAFAFEAIRTLEGYWRRRGLASWGRTLLIKRQLGRKRALEKRYHRAEARSFHAARPMLLRRRIDPVVLLAVEADITGAPRPDGMSTDQATKADELEWWDACEPWDSARLLRIQRDLEDFPRDARVMPTKLGNVLRVAEDGLRNSRGDVEGYVMRNRNQAPSRLLLHVDQFRTRLDMYCTLVFVAAALAISAIPVLWELSTPEIGGVGLAFAVLSFASYGAAISSARGYSAALRQVDTIISASQTATAAPSPTAGVPSPSGHPGSEAQ